MDDFLFHLERARRQRGNGAGAAEVLPQHLVRDVLEKLAISNWIVLIEYLRHKFFQLEQSAQEGLNLGDLKARKEVHRWRRSCAIFLEKYDLAWTA